VGIGVAAGPGCPRPRSPQSTVAPLGAGLPAAAGFVVARLAGAGVIAASAWVFGEAMLRRFRFAGAEAGRGSSPPRSGSA
jgi:hypothetical protein